ncbi:MAG: hypothetical protein CR217_06030 [Beijerinckiaceae bacterium]|nr:MAG: hypothetical protein CR217_06030 [Beijerinckiaceae bacterium]
MNMQCISTSLRSEIKSILEEMLERFDNKEVATDIISNELAQLSVLFEMARGDAVKRAEFWSKKYYEIQDNREAFKRTPH